MKARRADARANQARILAAACEIFAQHGLTAKIKDIADRAGVGVATIYGGFGSKEGLLLATAREASSRLTDLLEAAEQASDPLEGLHAFLVEIIHFVETYGWLLQPSLSSEDLQEIRRAADQRGDHRARFRHLIERCAEGGTFPTHPDPEIVLLLIEGIVVSLAPGRKNDLPRPPAESIADTLMALLTGENQATTHATLQKTQAPIDKAAKAE